MKLLQVSPGPKTLEGRANASRQYSFQFESLDDASFAPKDHGHSNFAGMVKAMDAVVGFINCASSPPAISQNDCRRLARRSISAPWCHVRFRGRGLLGSTSGFDRLRRYSAAGRIKFMIHQGTSTPAAAAARRGQSLSGQSRPNWSPSTTRRCSSRTNGAHGRSVTPGSMPACMSRVVTCPR